MQLSSFLEKNRSEIINESFGNLQRAHLKSYSQSGEEQNRKRLEKLFELTCRCVLTENLFEITEYSEKIARERFEAGFDLHEVHKAFNSLEETIWKKIISDVDPSELGKALGLISTVLGAGKESLALTYVSLAGKRKTTTLDLSSLFERN
ncbi:MAG: hypothetical protein IPM56_18405 [Ignavibacteriales bacterium]|nr:MAG: hypothetical protein IPM56_18405 [Ignavibacteriales bacterium]